MSNTTTTTFSPYQAAKVVNNLLAEMGIEKVLPPQMFYTYTKKGYIVTQSDGTIALEDLKTWFEKYSTKLQERLGTPVQDKLF